MQRTSLVVSICLVGACSASDQRGSDSDGAVASVSPVELTLEQATQIALDQVPGAFAEGEFETEHGIAAYSIDILRDGVEVEVRVHPETGEILSISEDDDVDGDDDDDDDDDHDDSDSDESGVSRG